MPYYLNDLPLISGSAFSGHHPRTTPTKSSPLQPDPASTAANPELPIT